MFDQLAVEPRSVWFWVKKKFSLNIVFITWVFEVHPLGKMQKIVESELLVKMLV